VLAAGGGSNLVVVGFFIHFGSFIFIGWRDRGGVAMVTAVEVGEKRRA
jgi:hypothetical protein